GNDSTAILQLAILESDVGPLGGPVKLAATAKNAAPIAGARWYFVPDSVGSIEGDTTPPAPVAALVPQSAVAAASELPAIQRIADTLWRLPSGEVVGPGIHFVREPVATETTALNASPTLPSGSARREVAPSSAALPQSINACDDQVSCGTRVDRPTGTFLVVARVNGQLLSASARLGAAGAGPTLSVTYTPAQQVRGDPVTCTAEVTPQMPYRMIEWKGEGSAGTEAHETVETVGADKAAGERSTWMGPAIVNTRVTATVQVSVNGQPQPLTASATYTVTPRVWPRLTLSGPLVPQVDVAHTEIAVYLPFFEVAGRDTSPEGALGITSVTPRYHISNVSEGPNTNWFYVTSPVTVTDFAIYTSTALEPGDPFYALQTGGRYNGSPSHYCSARDMNALKAQVLVHEQAHAQTAIQYYQQHDVQADFEAMVYYVDVSQIGQPGGPNAPAIEAAAFDAVYGTAFGNIQNQTVHQSGRYRVTLSCKMRYPAGHE
ncbi:MAG: hypothetical protein IRY91_16920, partial [Gemmatimonadaceae bacterium]|nr:hypothetical protein [Gemmatimonadaceae bacterium]